MPSFTHTGDKCKQECYILGVNNINISCLLLTKKITITKNEKYRKNSVTNNFSFTLGSFKRYVTPEEGREGSKLCYEPLRKSEGRGGGFSNAVT